MVSIKCSTCLIKCKDRVLYYRKSYVIIDNSWIWYVIMYMMCIMILFLILVLICTITGDMYMFANVMYIVIFEISRTKSFKRGRNVRTVYRIIVNPMWLSIINECDMWLCIWCVFWLWIEKWVLNMNWHCKSLIGEAGR